MKSELLRGKTIQWTFTDGPMANRSFEHVFHDDGSVTFRMLDGERDAEPTHVKRVEVASLASDVHAVSYLGPSGYTLTVVLDHRSGRIAAFASNEKELALQHGTFREVDDMEASSPTQTSPEHSARWPPTNYRCVPAHKAAR